MPAFPKWRLKFNTPGRAGFGVGLGEIDVEVGGSAVDLTSTLLVSTGAAFDPTYPVSKLADALGTTLGYVPVDFPADPGPTALTENTGPYWTDATGARVIAAEPSEIFNRSDNENFEESLGYRTDAVKTMDIQFSLASGVLVDAILLLPHNSRLFAVPTNMDILVGDPSGTVWVTIKSYPSIDDTWGTLTVPRRFAIAAIGQPVFTSASELNVAAGATFDFPATTDITATFGGAGFPVGWAINSTTGHLTGTLLGVAPRTSFYIFLTATNGVGTTVQLFTVNAYAPVTSGTIQILASDTDVNGVSAEQLDSEFSMAEATPGPATRRTDLEAVDLDACQSDDVHRQRQTIPTFGLAELALSVPPSLGSVPPVPPTGIYFETLGAPTSPVDGGGVLDAATVSDNATRPNVASKSMGFFTGLNFCQSYAIIPGFGTFSTAISGEYNQPVPSDIILGHVWAGVGLSVSYAPLESEDGNLSAGIIVPATPNEGLVELIPGIALFTGALGVGGNNVRGLTFVVTNGTFVPEFFGLVDFLAPAQGFQWAEVPGIHSELPSYDAIDSFVASFHIPPPPPHAPPSSGDFGIIWFEETGERDSEVTTPIVFDYASGYQNVPRGTILGSAVSPYFLPFPVSPIEPVPMGDASMGTLKPDLVDVGALIPLDLLVSVSEAFRSQSQPSVSVSAPFDSQITDNVPNDNILSFATIWGQPITPGAGYQPFPVGDSLESTILILGNDIRENVPAIGDAGWLAEFGKSVQNLPVLFGQGPVIIISDLLPNSLISVRDVAFWAALRTGRALGYRLPVWDALPKLFEVSTNISDYWTDHPEQRRHITGSMVPLTPIGAVPFPNRGVNYSIPYIGIPLDEGFAGFYFHGALWFWEPDWADTPKETYVFDVVAQRRLSGTDLRQQNDAKFIRKLAYKWTNIEPNDFCRLMLFVHRGMNKECWMPFWTRQVTLTTGYGGEQLRGELLVTTPHQFEPGGKGVVWLNQDVYNTFSVLAVDGGRLILAGGLAQEWPAGAEVYPLIYGRVDTPQIKSLGGESATSSFAFTEIPKAVLAPPKNR